MSHNGKATTMNDLTANNPMKFDDATVDGIDKPDTNNDVAVATPAAVPALASAQPMIDPFELYLKNEEGGSVFFDGDFINFNGQTGVWTRAKEPIGATTLFLVNMHEIWLGHVKLVDGKIVDRRIGRLIDGYVRTPVNELPDRDKRYWPLNRQREPDDPWKPTTYLPMRCLEDDEPVVYGPFAPTHLTAIKRFVAIYKRTDRAGKFPAVLLESSNFGNRSGGTTYVPEFKIVDWQFWDGQPAPEPPPVPLPSLPPGQASPAAAKPAAPADAKRADMDDELPF
jgi:hypothetical protein